MLILPKGYIQNAKESNIIQNFHLNNFYIQQLQHKIDRKYKLQHKDEEKKRWTQTLKEHGENNRNYNIIIEFQELNDKEKNIYI